MSATEIHFTCYFCKPTPFFKLNGLLCDVVSRTESNRAVHLLPSLRCRVSLLNRCMHEREGVARATDDPFSHRLIIIIIFGKCAAVINSFPESFRCHYNVSRIAKMCLLYIIRHSKMYYLGACERHFGVRPFGKVIKKLCFLLGFIFNVKNGIFFRRTQCKERCKWWS